MYGQKLQITRGCGVWTERAGTAGYGRIPMGWRQRRKRPSGRVLREGRTRQPHDRVGGESSLCVRHLVAPPPVTWSTPCGAGGVARGAALCGPGGERQDPAASDRSLPEGCNEK